MRALLALLMSAQAPVVAPVVPALPPALAPAPFDPAADYITAGQDEPGYRSWYLGGPWRAAQVKAFNDYLTTYQVGGILPTWQLLRTATAWEKCGGQPFEIPPTSEWPHVVQTLRYIHDYVIPAVGPVEPVSGYRNPVLNACAGGAPESAHKHYSAIDMVPLKPITRELLMRDLCMLHGRSGEQYGVGLGFYAFLRFHVDTAKYRRWGTDPAEAAACPPIIHPNDIASVGYQEPPPLAVPAPATTPAALPSPPGETKPLPAAVPQATPPPNAAPEQPH